MTINGVSQLDPLSADDSTQNTWTRTLTRSISERSSLLFWKKQHLFCTSSEKLLHHFILHRVRLREAKPLHYRVVETQWLLRPPSNHTSYKLNGGSKVPDA